MENWLNLQGKVVVVTGGANGIGRAVCEEFLRHGAYVVACDLASQAPTFENAAPETLLYVQADVTSKAQVADLFQKVQGIFGRVDILVNNAGITIPRLLVDDDPGYELDEATWDKVMNVNLKGLFFCSQEAARMMKAQGSGVIVNMSSECGLEGSEGQSVYAASKGAVNALTRSWAKELGRFGIRVVGVAPGVLEATALRTEAYEAALAHTRGISVEQLRAGYEKSNVTPLGRSGKLSEVAATTAFMASDQAGYITGVTLNVAGGKTRG